MNTENTQTGFQTHPGSQSLSYTHTRTHTHKTGLHRDEESEAPNLRHTRTTTTQDPPMATTLPPYEDRPLPWETGSNQSNRENFFIFYFFVFSM